MYRKEINAQSPLRILEQSIHGGLGTGNLGVVMARAGVGKTACLVQIGLDDLMRDKDVLHVAIGQTLDHVQSWYDALFDDLAARTRLEDREEERADVARHRVIKTFADGTFSVERIEEALGLFEKHLRFAPRALLIDGFPWEGPVATTAASLGALRAIAQRLGAELWMTAQTHREVTGEHPTGVPPPCAAYAELIDVALYLEPHGWHVDVRLLKDHDNPDIADDTHLKLHPDTMRLVAEEEAAAGLCLPPSAYTLLSGGAPGAEAFFGACAERWGVAETHFSFEGRGLERARGVVNLTEAELKQGEVSEAYLQAHMHRTYPQTALFKKVLQSIWHQVNTAGEVFTVGVLKPDGTVKGGTGWAAELGRHWGKPVHVYDQERRGWYAWRGGKWEREDVPLLRATRFTGTGTRFLSNDGRAAIEGLFQRTFGEPER
jgi:hypothetical protein